MKFQHRFALFTLFTLSLPAFAGDFDSARYLKLRLTANLVPQNVQDSLNRSARAGHFKKFQSDPCSLLLTRISSEEASTHSLRVSRTYPDGKVYYDPIEDQFLSYAIGIPLFQTRKQYQKFSGNCDSAAACARRIYLFDFIAFLTWSFARGEQPPAAILESELGENLLWRLANYVSRPYKPSSMEMNELRAVVGSWHDAKNSSRLSDHALVEKALKLESFVGRFRNPESLLEFADFVEGGSDIHAAAQFVAAFANAADNPHSQGAQWALLQAGRAIATTK